MSTVNINNKFIYNSCKLALYEDLYPSGDITSNLIESKSIIKANLISNDNGIIGGIKFVKMTFKILDKKIKFTSKISDGSKIKKGQVIGVLKGNVDAELVSIAGKFDGQVLSEVVSIRSTGSVNGEVSYDNISIEEGAKVEAQLGKKKQ